MDLATILLLIVGTFNLFLGLVIFIHGPKSKSDIVYVVFITTVVSWVISIIFLRLTNTWWGAYISLAASHWAGIGIALSLWYFTVFFTGGSPNRFQTSLLWLGAIITGVTASVSGNFTIDIQNVHQLNKTLIMGPLHLMFLLYFSILLIDAFYKLFQAYKKTDNYQRRIQFMLVFWGTLLTAVIGSVCNIYLLRMGISDYISFGPVATIIMVTFITYAIMQFNLMSVKVISAEFFALTLILTLAVRFILSNGTSEWIINGVSLIFAVSFGILLIKNVIREVEQREKLEVLTKQLESANEKLKELDHLKSEFLSFASHQIKAPLAAIKGFATLIYDGTYGEVSDKVSDAAHKITESSDRMAQLVTDFLNVRKIEEGKMEYKPEKIDGTKLIKDIYEELKPLAQKKKLEFNLEAESKEGWLNADAQRIRQVFQNLIENSIKYTDSGFVRVRVEVKENQFVFSVSDSGHGISTDLLPHLFEEFKRDIKERHIEGTGLGLFIAKNIVEVHKGKIWAESEGHGKGSTFFVSLPIVN